MAQVKLIASCADIWHAEKRLRTCSLDQAANVAARRGLSAVMKLRIPNRSCSAKVLRTAAGLVAEPRMRPEIYSAVRTPSYGCAAAQAGIA